MIISELEDKKQGKPNSKRRIVWLVVLAILGLAFWPTRQVILQWQAGQALRGAFDEANTGNLPAAEKSAWKAWSIRNDLYEAGVLAARLALLQQKFDKADEYLESVDKQSELSQLRLDLAIEALEIRAQVDEALLKLGRAEQNYRRLLELDSQHLLANQQLAKLLGASGRREEAIESILRLVAAGQRTDLLMLLTRESGAIRDDRRLITCRSKHPEDPFPLIGLAYYAHESGEETSAIKLLKAAIDLRSNYIPAHVMMIRLLSEEEAWGEFATYWLSLSDSLRGDLEKFAVVWIARGRFAESQQDSKGAIRCYLEALRLHPDSRLPNSRLAVLLSQDGNTKVAEQFASYSRALQELWSVQDRVLFTGTPDSTSQYLQVAEKYAACSRYWESLGWTIWAAKYAANDNQMQQRVAELRKTLEGAPLTLVDIRKHPAGTLDTKNYPLPLMNAKSVQPKSTPATESKLPELAFTDVAEEANFNFDFCYGTIGEPQRFMYELSGGGIGVLDYDMDGWPDMAVSQGKLWPPEKDQSSERLDQLFRNVEGKRFTPIPLKLSQDGFGQGVACGDFDNDGFPDIYIAQIGSNRLMKNMGDGTFVDVTDQSGISSERWTVSCLIADLNGDSLPDLYDVNYLYGSDLFQRVCRREGIAAQCSPFDFDGSLDAMWINDGAGGFNSVAGLPIGRGLGCVAFSAQGDGKVNLFITNDTDPNFLITVRGDRNAVSFTETGITSGLAFNEAGKAEGSMGIAVGDTNQDGLMDLFITNFLNETNTLYQNHGDGLFQDATKFSGLDAPSLDVLGFGTQFFDANLDGLPELFVANGHVDDLRALNRPYKMPAHLYSTNGTRFSLLKNAGDYFKRELLGRSVVKVDWNRDFREDLAISHLQSSYSLLTNGSKLERRPLAVRLVGTISSRDAVGSSVTLSQDGKRWTQQITAGDGYESSNEKQLLFGLSESEATIEVCWPTGIHQTIDVPETTDRLHIVEGN
ncbi:MAG: FG-GAP-like repeat-containing protein [Pirellulales bacterium]